MIRKDELPALENIEDFDPIVATYFQFTQLKRLYRQGWLQAGVSIEQCETVAEHSLGVVLLTALLGLHMKDDAEFDLKKALLMALFHDFGRFMRAISHRWIKFRLRINMLWSWTPYSAFLRDWVTASIFWRCGMSSRRVRQERRDLSRKWTAWRWVCRRAFIIRRAHWSIPKALLRQ